MSEPKEKSAAPAFTEKHYLKIAKALGQVVRNLSMVSYRTPEEEDVSKKTYSLLLAALCVHFAADNPRFEKNKFLASLDQVVLGIEEDDDDE